MTPNDIFRLVSYRGVSQETAIDLSNDPDVQDTDGPVVRRLREVVFPPSTENIRTLIRALGELDLDGAAQRLDALRKQLPKAEGKKVDYDGASLARDVLRSHELFHKDFANTYNLWLLEKVRDRNQESLRSLEQRLLAGLQIFKRQQKPPTSSPRIALPGWMLKQRTDARYVAASKADVRDAAPKASPSIDPASQIAAAQADLKAVSEIENGLARALMASGSSNAGTEIQDTLVFGRFETPLPAPEFSTVTRTVNTPLRLRDEAVSSLRNELGTRARTVLDEALAGSVGDPPLGLLIDRIAKLKTEFIGAANRLHGSLDIAVAGDTGALPEPEGETPLFEQGAVENLGWGDLIVVREALVDYAANEISHIENVLKNEKKVRKHSFARTAEEVFETEITEIEESERDLSTTTRNELQITAEKVIETDFQIDSGLNTSGRYGLTKVETSLELGLQRSTRDAVTTTTDIAKEIVSKAVERSSRSARTLQRRTVTTEVRDENSHELDNVAKDGGPETASISGVYKWVERTHQIEMRHYGTRMMIEFMVPEPALSILGFEQPIEVDVPKPQPVTFDASEINEGNYLAYAAQWGAAGVGPPPPTYRNVGFTWASAVTESDDENKSESVLSETIPIDEDYQPLTSSFHMSAHPSHAQHFQVRLHIGDNYFSQNGDAYFSDHVALHPSRTWSEGVPVSMTAHGHYDRTLSLNITIFCIRTEEAYVRWQIDTFEKIVAAQERQQQAYLAAMQEARLQSEIVASVAEGPSSVNRRTEQEELQKWAIKILRRVPFDFDAIRPAGSGDQRHPEVDPGHADQQAALVRFYEEAFEWRNMSYFFYPYYWGRRNSYKLRQAVRHSDPRFESFLRAGAARMIVPVTPGFEARILYYLARPDISEADKITDPLVETGEPPEAVKDTIYDALWLEQAIARNADLALGSGFLSVTQGNAAVEIVESRWEATARDVGRELYIDGDRYEITAIIDAKNVTLDADFAGLTNTRAPYATGSVAFGRPWLVDLPTNLVILEENKDKVRLRR